MRHTSRERGSVLLFAVIALAILMVVVAGAIAFTGTNRDAAAAKNRGDKVTACADVARRHVLARLRHFEQSVNPTDLVFKGVLPDATDEAHKTEMMTAHYGDVVEKPTIVQVDAAEFGAAADQVRDIANVLPGAGTLGGQYYRIVVKCREPNSTRESELEFVFRHGV